MRTSWTHGALVCGTCLLLTPALVFGAPAAISGHGPSTRATARVASAAIDPATRVDHDGRPIPQPPEWHPPLWGEQVREAVVDPLTHAFDIPDKLLWGARAFGARWPREAVNVNAFDEVPNSTWFTNRNHVRSVPLAQMRAGPHALGAPAKPWTIKRAKQGGYSLGFQIKDADGKKWLVKLDRRGYAQLGSGADKIARSLMHAAGYTVPHNTSIRFRRDEVRIDDELRRGGEDGQFDDAALDTLLSRAATFADGSYSGYASVFVKGEVLGWPSMYRNRPGDSNDWYHHINRRDLRGLFVLCSWIGNWDTKESNLLDSFVADRDSLGHVDHYLLDVGSALGAAANGPKALWWGYEGYLDWGWIARRVVTLGFVVEPWRRAHQETGIPSVGNFESEVYRPDRFTSYVPHPAFREMTDRDGYWGAKLVASFSDAQIAAAVEGAEFEDPRATVYLTRTLIERRNKVARHWFGRVAPLDFFVLRDGVLRFHDLAVDLGHAADRSYVVRVTAEGGGSPASRRLPLTDTELKLADFGGANRLRLEFSIAGDAARPTRVDLVRGDSGWTLARVEHG